jgi:hypothetical protein
MSNLLGALLLGGYGFLVLPAIVLLVMTLFDHSRDPEQPTRGRILMFLVWTAFVLALLGLLIWFNPYGREINSSIPAAGVLIVLIALLVYLLSCWRVLASLWASEKALVTSFALVYLGLFIFLFLGDPVALLMVVVPTLAFTFILQLSRAGIIVLTIFSLLILAVIILTAGGWIYIPTADQPAWSQTARSILMGIALLISILLPAGLLYMSLRISPDGKKPPLVWTLVLTVILLAGVVYQSFWEGIWSSAHARAFEDHLPIFQFLLSLVAGLLLALILSGYRKWIGPIYMVLVTAVAVAAFARGWNVSAFDRPFQAITGTMVFIPIAWQSLPRTTCPSCHRRLWCDLAAGVTNPPETPIVWAISAAISPTLTVSSRLKPMPRTGMCPLKPGCVMICGRASMRWSLSIESGLRMNCRSIPINDHVLQIEHCPSTRFEKLRMHPGVEFLKALPANYEYESPRALARKEGYGSGKSISKSDWHSKG